MVYGATHGVHKKDLKNCFPHSWLQTLRCAPDFILS